VSWYIWSINDLCSEIGLEYYISSLFEVESLGCDYVFWTCSLPKLTLYGIVADPSTVCLQKQSTY
jgi:hypothetical protein